MQIRDNTKKLVAVIIFLVSFALLLRFIDLFRNSVPQSFVFFWLFILCIFASLMYQVFRFGNSKRWQWAIISQIMLITFLFHIIRLLLTDGSAFVGDDDYIISHSALYMKNHSDFLATGPLYAKWPIFQLLTISISEVFHVELFDIAFLLPSVVNTIGTIFIYLIARELYNDNRTALLAYVVFSPYWYLGATYGRFHLESLGYVFFMACIFAYTKNLRHKQTIIKYSSLLIFFVFAVTLTHYTTNAFLIAFFIAMLLQLELLRLSKLAKARPTSPILIFVVLSLVIWLAYWMYIEGYFLNIMVYTAADLQGPSVHFSPGFYSPPAQIYLKTIITTKINQFYIVLFAAMMVYEVFGRRKCKNWTSDFLLTFWAGVMVLIWLLFNTNIASAPPSRVNLFLYPFVLMIICHIILKFRSHLLKALFCLLLIGFMLINVYQLEFLPLSPLDNYALFSQYGLGIQEVQAVSQYQGEGEVACAAELKAMFAYYHDVDANFDIRLFEDSMAGLKSYSWLYLNSVNPRFRATGTEYKAKYPILDEETLLAISHAPWLSKFYNNGKYVIFRLNRFLSRTQNI